MVNETRNIAHGTTDENTLNTVYGNEVIDLTNESKEYIWILQVYELDGIEKGIWIGLCDINSKNI